MRRPGSPACSTGTSPKPVPPKVTKSQVADSYNGFELVVGRESFSDNGDADYNLFISKQDNGDTVVEIVASVTNLVFSELELKYDQARYQPVRGAYGDWPDDFGIVRQGASLGTSGTAKYNAEVMNTAGASGGISMVTFVFSQATQVAGENLSQQTSLLDPSKALPRTAPASFASQNRWPNNNNEIRWLEDYYLNLPRLDSQYSVYGDSQTSDWADQIFSMTNEERRDKKHTLLRRDPHLDAVAQAMAVHMAQSGFFDHVNPLGMDVFERIEVTDAPEWWSAGENIAAGYMSPAAAHKGWMDSSGHKKNIRNEKYRYIGIGVFHAPETDMKWYWVQVFATFDEDPASHDWIDPGESRP